MTGTIRGVLSACAVAVLFAIALAAASSHAQEFDPASEVSDSSFVEAPRSPVSYMTDYSHDQIRGAWNQSLTYSRAWKRVVVGLGGTSGTSEDVLALGSRSTTGDLNGRIDWKAVKTLILSVDGRYSMSSIADGLRASTSDQRRNNLALRSQYAIPLPKKASLFINASSEFQRNYDLRFVERIARGDSIRPDSVAVQRDSSYASGRLDGVRASLALPLGLGMNFAGNAFASRNRPTTTVRTLRSSTPVDGTAGVDSVDVQSIQLPIDNAVLDGTLTFDNKRGTRAVMGFKRSGIDQVYFDLGQRQVEQFSNDSRLYNSTLSSLVAKGIVVNASASLSRNLREYVARSNLNSLVTTREGTVGVAYTSPVRMIFTSMTINRGRAERQTTANGVTINRVLTTNFQQRLSPHLWLVGLGTANLASYRYTFPASSQRSFSKDDRDVATGLASIGVRFGITPRCSTMTNFSINRTHNVSLDETRSNGNIENTIYQLNAALRLPMNRNLTIGQDYVLTATYRFFDFNQGSDDLSRVFRIDTTVSDTLFPFAFIRMNHRYYFFDRGDYTERTPGGEQAYGVALKQVQQILEGTIGIRPVRGVTFLVKQSLADTETHDLINLTESGTEQWNLSWGMEVNRTFWGGAGLTGSVRREDRYQLSGGVEDPTTEEGHWLAGITFQKDF